MSDEDFGRIVITITENLGLMKGSDEEDTDNINIIQNLIANSYGLK